MLTGATPAELRELKKVQDEKFEAYGKIQECNRHIAKIIGGIKRRQGKHEDNQRKGV